MFTVILQRPPESAAPDDEKSTVKGREKMLELIQQNPSITMKDLAEHLGRSPKSIEKQIRLLKAEGILTRQGPDRGGEWRVIPKPQE
jgi:ATP-dependent DNA helicase RecG